MDTIEPMVLRGPLDWHPLPPPGRWAGRRLGVAGLLAAGLLVGAVSIDLPYFAVAPGSARQVNDLIAVPDDRALPPRGRMLLATVSLRRVNALDALRGWLDPATDVVPEQRILGTTPKGRFTRQNLQQMDDSKQFAVVVALRRLGFPVAEQGTGALVVRVEPGSPADGHLAEGDVVTAIDGEPTPVSDAAVAVIRSRRPDVTVHLSVTPASGGERTEDVALGRSPSRDAAFLGVVMKTKEQRFDVPFRVDIDSGSIGGPSAGLAFTLGLLDVLTPGELTGGRKVAATGTIQLDGTVGDVGGVIQKTAAVRAAGAVMFLVPPGEFDEAVSHAGRHLKVRRVATLDDAIAALGELGGDVDGMGQVAVGARA